MIGERRFAVMRLVAFEARDVLVSAIINVAFLCRGRPPHVHAVAAGAGGAGRAQEDLKFPVVVLVWGVGLRDWGVGAEDLDWMVPRVRRSSPRTCPERSRCTCTC